MKGLLSGFAEEDKNIILLTILSDGLRRLMREFPLKDGRLWIGQVFDDIWGRLSAAW